MVSSVFRQAAELLRKRKRNKRWMAVLLCLAVLVAAGTFMLLKPTGRAMTREEKVFHCSYVAHAHTETCYDGEGALLCGYGDYVIHTHKEDCYGSEGALVCPLPEVEVHIHEAGCFEEEQTLICGQESGNGGHEHTEACFTGERTCVCGLEEHAHTETCYGEDQTGICGLEEHIHVEECYTVDTNPVCGLEIGAGGHEHTEACIQTEQRLLCEKPEIRPHIHEAGCYGTEESGNEVRICGLLQVEEHIHGEECFETIEVAVAETMDPTVSQEETSGAAGEQTETDGETVETEETTKPEGETAEETSGAEEETEEVEETTGTEEETEEVEETTGTEEETAETEETDGQEETEDVEEIFTQSWENERYIVTAAYKAAANLPENAELQVEEITPESDPERYARRDAQAQELLEEDMRLRCLFHIGFYVDGVEVEPEDTVKVTIQFLDEEGCAKGAPVTVVHFKEEETEILEGSQVDENGASSFDTDSFSDIALYLNEFGVLTESDGKVRDYNGLKQEVERLSEGGTREITLEADFAVEVGQGPLTLPINANVVLDLNGHTITVNSGVSLFSVTNNATLIVKDSGGENPVQDSGADEGEWNGYGWTGDPGSMDGGVLTYYEIRSEGQGSSTVERLYRHQVTGGGRIIRRNSAGASNDALIFVKEGTFTLEGGMLEGGGLTGIITLAETPLIANTLNLQGGYICNGKSSLTGNNWVDKKYQASGGAVVAGANTNIHLNGTVIANNRTEYAGTQENWGSGGGIAMLGSGTLRISGGMVTGNQSSVYGKGGGIYTADNVAVTMEGGSICNNLDAYREVTGSVAERKAEYGQYDGGGGILVGKSFTMTGGQIVGNTGAGGGGIQTTANGSDISIQCGVIARNLATLHEGGGLVVVGEKGYAKIKGEAGAVYITNNRTATLHDWGGGGIFCVENATVNIQSALITNNRAAGYGGGVGGCSNAQIVEMSPITLDIGTAVYGNQAEGRRTTDSWYKEPGSFTQDEEFAQHDGTFLSDFSQWFQNIAGSNGYSDYYCEQHSIVSNRMLGGGYSNWIGSSNSTADISGQSGNESTQLIFSREKDDVRTSTNRMGLTADPSEQSRQAAAGAARVYITGNHSETHGGGVQCNGILVLGDYQECIFGDTLVLTGLKQLFGADGQEKTSMEAGRFTFGLYEYEETEEENKGKKIGEAVNGTDGTISFSPLSITGNGTDTSFSVQYLILEEEPSVGGVLKDSARYRVRADVAMDTLTAVGNQNYTWKQYNIEQVTVERWSEEAGDWEPVRTMTKDDWQGTSGAKTASLTEPGVPTFVNREIEKIDLRIQKDWKDGSATDEAKAYIQSVTVQLYRSEDDGGSWSEYDPAGDSGTKELTEADGWTYEWKGLDVRRDGQIYQYKVKEIGINFMPDSPFDEGDFVNDGAKETDTKVETSGGLGASTLTIINTHVDDLKYSLRLSKWIGDETGASTGSLLAGAEFSLYRINPDGNETLLSFTGSNGSFEYVGDADAEVVEERAQSEEELSEGVQAEEEHPETEGLQKPFVTLITNQNGEIFVRNLPAGTYRIRETKAPAGYLPVEDMDVKVDADAAAESGAPVKEDAADSAAGIRTEVPTEVRVEIVDPLYSYTLPESGGIGTTIFYLAGGSLIIVAGILLLIRRRIINRTK
ncbi:MAG: LPXTG cell wall anchor domain-containing protein [Lachnospiraceae bacterium]|nr:LPXTG cell wall anchor domain-containing protein [Lachnospiraceae bacterium]